MCVLTCGWNTLQYCTGNIFEGIVTDTATVDRSLMQNWCESNNLTKMDYSTTSLFV
jgi:hypothetical protein